MFFYLKASSKNQKVLKSFIMFLSKFHDLPVAIKHIPSRKKRKFITVLNSPHVNKSAQEQFEFRYYNEHFLIVSSKPSLFFLILKKIKACCFSGLDLQVKRVLNQEARYLSTLTTISPDNVKLSKLSKIQASPTPALQKYIQLFDCYGEICLKDFLCSNM